MTVGPFTAQNFIVEIDSMTLTGFTEVILPTASVDVVEYRDGSDGARTRKLPGLRKYGHLTLKRGVTGSDELYQWWRQTANGQTSRRMVSVSLLDDANQPVRLWRLFDVWPHQYRVEPLVALSETVLVEILDCAVEYLE